MKKIILTVLSATLLLASTAIITEKPTKTDAHKSLNERLAEKQKLRKAKIEAEIAKKELARVEQTKLRENKIQAVDAELKEKAQHRAEA